MTYQNEADLAEDVAFSRRLSACLSTEAKGKSDALAGYVLTDPVVGAQYFVPYLSTAPGFGDTYATGGSEAIQDPEILAAVQANWDAVAALHP